MTNDRELDASAMKLIGRLLAVHRTLAIIDTASLAAIGEKDLWLDSSVTFVVVRGLSRIW